MPNNTTSELLDTDGLIRRLKKGAPLLLEKETVRLPRFTEIREVEQSEIGGKGQETLVIARARTATWAMMPWKKKTSFGTKDAEAFLKMVAILQEQNPQKPVKGYVLTGGAINDAISSMLEAGGHLASAVAE